MSRHLRFPLAVLLTLAVSCASKHAPTAPGPDPIPSILASTSPPDHATGQSATTSVVASFKNPISRGSVTTSSFRLESAGVPVATHSPIPSDDRRSFTLIPLEGLAPATTYVVRLTKDILDINGRIGIDGVIGRG